MSEGGRAAKESGNLLADSRLPSVAMAALAGDEFGKAIFGRANPQNEPFTVPAPPEGSPSQCCGRSAALKNDIPSRARFGKVKIREINKHRLTPSV
jgi:hypothetical protein